MNRFATENLSTFHIAPLAKELAWKTSDFGPDREHVARSLLRIPYLLHLPVVSDWARHHKSAGSRAANLKLLDLADSFGSSGLDFAASDDEIVSLSKSRARNVKSYVMDRMTTPEALRSRLERYARTVGVRPPLVKDLRGLVARMTDDLWWRRALRRSTVREFERLAISFGFVHRRAGLYASDEAVYRRAQQRKRNLKVLEALEAENDVGERFTIAEIASHHVSNPAVRRAELMTRIAGFEEFAQARGDAAMFFTLTCPSRMHARFAKSGEPNPKYDGTSPRAAQEHLRRQWAKARAKMHRRGAWIYGFRIAEPHHDGTPHWHLLLFMRPDYVTGVNAILEHYASEVDAAELDSDGARGARFKVVAIDWSRGSAAGYIAKYVAKNVDGFNVGEDLEAESVACVSDTVKRVDTWASTWGIRQFQQIGGPGVTIWRELRRLHGAQKLPLFDPLLEAANAGQWAEFVRAMGGMEIRRRDRTLSLWRVDYEKQNRYEEPAPAAIEGVEHFALELCRTRMRVWEIRRAPVADALLNLPAIRLPGPSDVPEDSRPSSAVSGVAWTGVNNCTPVEYSITYDEWVADYVRGTSGRSAAAVLGP